MSVLLLHGYSLFCWLSSVWRACADFGCISCGNEVFMLPSRPVLSGKRDFNLSKTFSNGQWKQRQIMWLHKDWVSIWAAGQIEDRKMERKARKRCMTQVWVSEVGERHKDIERERQNLHPSQRVLIKDDLSDQSSVHLWFILIMPIKCCFK